MANGKDEIKKKLARKGEGVRRISWQPDSIRTDESDLYGMTGNGVSMRIVKGIGRGDFLLTYLKDIRMALGLNDAQIQILLVLTGSNSYKSLFKWSTDSISHVCSVSGLSRRTVSDAFSNLVARKGLIIKVNGKGYELNKKMLIHRSQIANPNEVNVIMTYRFAEPKTPLDALIEQYPNVSIELVEAIKEQAEMINRQGKAIQEMYNKAERERIQREEEKKNKQVQEKAKEEKLSKNKWE